MKAFTHILLLTTICWLTGCSENSHETHETRFMMGTLVQFTVIHADQKLARQAIRAASDEMQRVENQFTIYGTQPNDIKRFNQTAPHTLFKFNAETHALLQIAQQIQQQSHGAFNVSLGMLNQLWGFSQPKAPQAPPKKDRIAIYQSGIENCLQQQGLWWLRTSSHCQLDLGAIAKGYAIDQGIKILKTYNIQHAMINAGGDIALIGQHGDKPWRIGIRDPRHKDKIIATINLSGDTSIVTSGDYERFFTYQGARYHHILDPHTGYPSLATQSTTVINQQASLADAWSTALFVLGKDAMQVANQYGLKCLIIDASGQLKMTKNMPLNLPQAQ